ncbi:COX15/CtaA family protein [Halopelagius longus]|uniref:Cytochrome c oxidase assembly protein subunit 15 n=1 Tax=Halopelagius longus TaxID=1236180 RepID=A0A1H0YQB2_9EURY|nr:COX15/CtaA family protein [Halopelagius longus]RDI72605.1 heme A synthase [Halopelagius longus]SDQ17026.1 cytochrome c oxidase assembly protein subunit 15 [Halopelagius longus]
MNTRLRRLVAASFVLTGILMVLGVYTAAAGAGLTCAGRWPFCDGFLGLFPANWSSFIEWFHRLVAMVTGFLVLGTTLLAWREGAARRIRVSLAVSTILLPSQIILGALTVTTYQWVILTAHFLTASIIFTGVALAAAWAFETADPTRVRTAVTVAAAGLLVMVVATPHAFVPFGANVQAVYYGVGLAAYAALLAATVWTADAVEDGLRSRLRLTTGAAAVLTVSLLVLGRQVYGGGLEYVSLAGTAIAFGLAAAAAWLLYDRTRAGRVRGVPGGSD